MRHVLVDTNLLVAAVVWPQGVAAGVLLRVLDDEVLVLTDYVVDEFRDVIARKFAAYVDAAEAFLSKTSYEVLPAGTSSVVIRDAKDQPILDAAIAGAVDMIVTGDKGFHALDIGSPVILTPRQYLDLPPETQ